MILARSPEPVPSEPAPIHGFVRIPRDLWMEWSTAWYLKLAMVIRGTNLLGVLLLFQGETKRPLNTWNVNDGWWWRMNQQLDGERCVENWRGLSFWIFSSSESELHAFLNTFRLFKGIRSLADCNSSWVGIYLAQFPLDMPATGMQALSYSYSLLILAQLQQQNTHELASVLWWHHPQRLLY